VAIIKPALDTNGYLRTMIVMNGKNKTIKVHRIVAEHWCENQMGNPQVNHINHIRTDNRAENLEWVTQRQNIDWMMKHGRQTMNNGEKNGMTKLTAEKVLAMRAEYKPKVFTAKMIAEKYKISVGHTKVILQGRAWAFLK
jgi:hypothetical protein